MPKQKTRQPKTRQRKPEKAGEKKIRLRKCMVTGESCPTSRLIRFVLDPDGRVIPDVAGKLPGRGGWILAEGKWLKAAMKKKTFIRFGQRIMAAEDRKEAVLVDNNLPDQVRSLLRHRCLNYLGLVKRAGLVVSGFEKVRAALRADKCRALITAEDAAKGGRDKLYSGTGNVLEKLTAIDMFTREEMGQALGLSNAVHVALSPGGMTESFLEEFFRYEAVVLR